MDQKQFRLAVKKHLSYALLLFLAYLVQETPGFLSFWGVKPHLVICFVTAVAVEEGAFAGGLYGCAGGILCDTAAFHIFGIASMLFLVLGCAAGLLVIYWVRPGWRAAVLFTGGFSLFYGLAAWFLLYGLWGFEEAGLILWRTTIPGAALSAAFAWPVYRLVTAVRGRFTAREEGGERPGAIRREQK